MIKNLMKIANIKNLKDLTRTKQLTRPPIKTEDMCK